MCNNNNNNMGVFNIKVKIKLIHGDLWILTTLKLILEQEN